MDLYFLWLNKDQWEFIYFIAVILLTAIIVFITVKTYIYQVRKKSELLCRCVEASPDPDTHRINIFLEIYNYSNYLSRNIKVQSQGKNFGIIPFLMPGESAFYLVGNKHSFAAEITSVGFDLTDNILEVILNIDNGKEVQVHKVNIKALATLATFSKKAATSFGEYFNTMMRNPFKH